MIIISQKMIIIIVTAVETSNLTNVEYVQKIFTNPMSRGLLISTFACMIVCVCVMRSKTGSY
jgi:hypothetical protein